MKRGVIIVERNENENLVPKRRRAGAKAGENKKRNITIIIVALCAIVLACVCFFAFNISFDKNIAAKGVCVGDIELSGKTRDEVRESLAVLEDSFLTSEVELGIDGRNEIKNVKAEDIGLEFDLDGTVEKVFPEKRPFSFLIGIGKKDVGYAFKYDAIALTRIADEFTADVGGNLKEHEISIDDGYVTVKAGAPGLGISAKDVEKAIINNFKPYEKSKAKVKMRETEPEPMTVEYLYELTKREKKDARFIYENGAIEISDEVDGAELDREDAENKLNGFGVGSEDVKIKLIVTPAEVKKEGLQGKLFADVLGKYTTYYNAGNVNRSINVELAAKNINGKVLLPGEEFSYNETVGPRTAERGFKSASVYVGSKVESGMGGGICQTCSTLYPAVLYADLEVVERRNHSLEVNYVPLGMDATVAWGAIDFRFKNSTNYPIKIQSSYGKGVVTVSILGTKEDKNKKVEVVTETVSYIPFTEIEMEKADLAPGEKTVYSNGFNGSTVNTYKVYYENNVEVSRKFIGKSVYKMAQKVWHVGPTPAEEIPEGTGSEEVPTGDAGETTEVPVSGNEATPMPEPTPEPDENTAVEIIAPEQTPGVGQDLPEPATEI